MASVSLPKHSDIVDESYENSSNLGDDAKVRVFQDTLATVTLDQDDYIRITKAKSGMKVLAINALPNSDTYSWVSLDDSDTETSTPVSASSGIQAAPFECPEGDVLALKSTQATPTATGGDEIVILYVAQNS